MNHNNTRGWYPPGIGNGRGGGTLNPNPNFQNRNPHYSQLQPPYPQRTVQNQQPQQWMRRNPGAYTVPNEIEKTFQAEAIGSTPRDWKAQLMIPPPDTRYKTEVR